MKITKASVVYAFVCNFFVSLMLCITAALVNSPFIDPVNFFINLGVGYGIATIIGIFFPLVEVGKRFTKLMHVVPDNFKGNRLYRYYAVLAITLVYFAFVSPSLAILNYFIVPNATAAGALIGWCKNILPLLTVGYATSLVSDYFTYKLAHHIDPSF